MALTKCRDCAEPVSSRADVCRFCGRAMPWGRWNKTFDMQLLLIILIIFFGYHL